MHRLRSAVVLLPLLLAMAEALSLQQAMQQNMQQALKSSLGGLGARVATAAAGPAKDDYDGYGGESVAQLAETSQENCRPLGCPGVCVSGYAWTSRFTCNQHDSYGYGYGHNKLGRHTFTQVMGECNWEFWPYAAAPSSTCPWVPVVNGQTYRIGAASGRCTFPGGDQCGEPLCSTLRVTIDADVYVTAAYTSSSTSALIQDPDCAALLNWDALDPTGCPATLPLRSAAPRKGNNNTVAQDPINTPQVGMYDVSTAAYGGYQDYAATSNYGGYHDAGAATYYPATAIVISGSVTSQSGQKHGCYSEGSIEYVPYVNVAANAVAVPCPPGAVIVNSQDLTIGFTKNSCGYN